METTPRPKIQIKRSDIGKSKAPAHQPHMVQDTAPESSTTIKKLPGEAFEYRGRKVIDTYHSIDRFIERYGEEYREKVNKVLRDTIDVILNHGDNYGAYGVHSKGTGIGIAVKWKRQGDPRLDDGKNHAIIATILPIKHAHWLSRDEVQILVEQFKMLTEEKVAEGKVCTNEATCDYSLYCDDEGIYIITWEGKYYDHTIENLIVID